MAISLDNMENIQDINSKLDTIISLLNNIASNNIKNINEALQEQEEPTEEERGYNLVDALANNNLPNDIDFTKDIAKLVERLRLRPLDLDTIFYRLDKYQQENEIKDIRKLTFKFMYNYKKELTTGIYGEEPKKKKPRKRKS